MNVQVFIGTLCIYLGLFGVFYIAARLIDHHQRHCR